MNTKKKKKIVLVDLHFPFVVSTVNKEESLGYQPFSIHTAPHTYITLYYSWSTAIVLSPQKRTICRHSYVYGQSPCVGWRGHPRNGENSERKRGQALWVCSKCHCQSLHSDVNIRVCVFDSATVYDGGSIDRTLVVIYDVLRLLMV